MMTRTTLCTPVMEGPFRFRRRVAGPKSSCPGLSARDRRGPRTLPRPRAALLIDGLGAPGTAGTYPALGRPDLVLGGGDEPCGTRTAGFVSPRIGQYLVEDLLRQFGQDKARIVRVEHLEAVHHHLIAGNGTALVHFD